MIIDTPAKCAVKNSLQRMLPISPRMHPSTYSTYICGETRIWKEEEERCGDISTKRGTITAAETVDIYEEKVSRSGF